MLAKHWRKLAITSFKYMPVFTAGVMLIHVALLLCGISLGIAEAFCGLSILPLFTTYCFSKGFGFCWIHRMFIDYTAKIFICIQFQTWVGFGAFLTFYRWLMLILGIGIFIYFFLHLDKFVECNSAQLRHYGN